MPRDFEPSLVSGLDDRVQFCSRYVYEGLKGGHTLIGPKVHRFAGVFRPSKLMYGQSEIACAFQIWPGDMQFGAGNFASVNPCL